MIDRDKLLGILRQKGPVLPVHIAKEVETTILFASAMLSELVSAKLVKVSTVKIGGSPVYYLPEQNSRLQEFSKHLPQKEREAYDLLKNAKVLRESEQEPAIKVALRNMKDFSWPLKVTVGDQPEIFWKWYLLSNEEAGAVIRKNLGVGKKKEEQKPQLNPAPIQEKPKADHQKQEIEPHPKPELLQKPETKPEQPKEMEPKPAPKPPETQQKLEPEAPNPLSKTLRKPAGEEKNIKKEAPQKGVGVSNAFAGRVMAFFSQNSIRVLKSEAVRKNEIDFIVELQSAVGSLKYYCKAKEKKRIGDSDLSSAYVQGELRKLPVLFLSTGEPSKRADEMLKMEFQNIVYKQIGGI